MQRFLHYGSQFNTGKLKQFYLYIIDDLIDRLCSQNKFKYNRNRIDQTKLQQFGKRVKYLLKQSPQTLFQKAKKMREQTFRSEIYSKSKINKQSQNLINKQDNFMKNNQIQKQPLEIDSYEDDLAEYDQVCEDKAFQIQEQRQEQEKKQQSDIESDSSDNVPKTTTQMFEQNLNCIFIGTYRQIKRKVRRYHNQYFGYFDYVFAKWPEGQTFINKIIIQMKSIQKDNAYQQFIRMNKKQEIIEL